MIRIQNVYYMLAYAFQVLDEHGYKRVATEKFDNAAELCAAILIRGIESLMKRGLGKGYVPHAEALSSLRGKIDVSASLKNQTFLRKQMVCSYDEFSANTLMNQIVKTTAFLLLRADISTPRKKRLRYLLFFFRDVDEIDLHTVNWNIQYNRNNQTYRMLISICRLVVQGLLQTQSDGTLKLMDFLDEQRMHRLYEKFILEYYKKEFPQLTVRASQIPWALDDDADDLLPIMQSDIMLSRGNNVLIIDAKYYANTMQRQHDVRKLHSGNLYQIYTYVKNKDAEYRNTPHSVAGMLLYAKTDEAVQPDHVYRMTGNKISVKTLDLDRDFSVIRTRLDGIITEHFDEPKSESHPNGQS